MQGLPTACRLLVSDSTWHSGSLTRLRAREGGAADPTIGPQRATWADHNHHAREPPPPSPSQFSLPRIPPRHAPPPHRSPPPPPPAVRHLPPAPGQHRQRRKTVADLPSAAGHGGGQCQSRPCVRRLLWVLAAAAPAPVVAAASVPSPTAASFPPASAPPRSRPPHVAPRSVAPVDDAASAAAVAPALWVARLHALVVRWPPRSGGGTLAAAASAGGVVRPRQASTAAAGATSVLPSMAA